MADSNAVLHACMHAWVFGCLLIMLLVLLLLLLLPLQGKVVFITPTRPLVEQQFQACKAIMGIHKVGKLSIVQASAPLASVITETETTATAILVCCDVEGIDIGKMAMLHISMNCAAATAAAGTG
jgi:hypothetical protein